ncbi:MAG: RHS repeat-associated core domain-containing protein [Pseudomonadota bacterium]
MAALSGSRQGDTWNFSHDVEDNLIETADPLGNLVTNTFDNLNRLATLTDELSNTTGMTYDENNALTSYTDPRNLQTTMAYNGFGELISEDSPDRGQMTYAYDRRGLISSETDGRGTTRSMLYDDDGRLTQTSFVDSDPLTNEAGETQSFQFGTTAGSNFGELVQIADETGTTDYTYDSRGNIIRQVVTLAGSGHSFTTDYRYPSHGYIDRITYPSKRSILTGWRQNGTVTKMRMRVAPGNPWVYITEFGVPVQWMPFGDIRWVGRANLVSYQSFFDNAYRVKWQRNRNASGAIIRRVDYTYTSRDNLMSETYQSPTSPDPVVFKDVTYGYDERGMLEEATGEWLTGAPNARFSWTYDGVGNRLTERLESGAGASAPFDQTATYAYPTDSNRLASVTGGNDPADPLLSYTTYRKFNFDGMGNPIEEVRDAAVYDYYSYGYNAAGRLAWVELHGVRVAEYTYNALGQQVIRKTWPAGVETTILNLFDLEGRRIAEYDISGATPVLLREYIWLVDRPFAVVEGGQTYWIHWDHLNRPVMATDASGSVVWQATYTPFGGIREVSVDTGALSSQNLRFPGQWFQSETGYHQNWHRDYDPTTGRYLQADPLGLVDGASVYGYAKQSPLRYTDPTGLSVEPVRGPFVQSDPEPAIFCLADGAPRLPGPSGRELCRRFGPSIAVNNECVYLCRSTGINVLNVPTGSRCPLFFFFD